MAGGDDAGLLGQIHEFTIRTNASASVTPEGRVVQTHTDTNVRGSLHLADAAEVIAGGRFAEGVTVTARIAGDIDVKPGDTVVVAGIDNFNGVYQVATIRPTPRHVRLMLRLTNFDPEPNG